MRTGRLAASIAPTLPFRVDRTGLLGIRSFHKGTPIQKAMPVVQISRLRK
jgi:hypothetical protein